MTDHKPCPFCGGAVDPKGFMMQGRDNDVEFGPECENCGATAPDMATWNERVLASSIDALTEILTITASTHDRNGRAFTRLSKIEQIYQTARKAITS